MNDKYTIALVEDEKDLNNLIKTYLKKENYNVISFFDGESAINSLNQNINLWILDIMLPGDINGYDIIKEIRKNDTFTPVIFTSARDKDLDKIIGLELGSDDYITKPYSPKELVLRVNNIIKRVYSDNKKDNLIINYENYVIDINKRFVSEQDKKIELTSLEFDLLLYFINNKDKSLNRDSIINSVWGNEYYGTDRVVDDLIRRLRKKMPKLNISTIYGFGYRLV